MLGYLKFISAGRHIWCYVTCFSFLLTFEARLLELCVGTRAWCYAVSNSFALAHVQYLLLGYLMHEEYAGVRLPCESPSRLADKLVQRGKQTPALERKMLLFMQGGSPLVSAYGRGQGTRYCTQQRSFHFLFKKQSPVQETHWTSTRMWKTGPPVKNWRNEGASRFHLQFLCLLRLELSSNCFKDAHGAGHVRGEPP